MADSSPGLRTSTIVSCVEQKKHRRERGREGLFQPMSNGDVFGADGRARVLAFSRCKQAGRPVVWARVTCELVRARAQAPGLCRAVCLQPPAACRLNAKGVM